MDLIHYFSVVGRALTRSVSQSVGSQANCKIIFVVLVVISYSSVFLAFPIRRQQPVVVVVAVAVVIVVQPVCRARRLLSELIA